MTNAHTRKQIRAAGTFPKLSGSAFRLLTPGNPKTVKGQKKGYYTFILHLAPADESGFEVCPGRSAGCTASCLHRAGRGGIISKGETDNAIGRARVRRTVRYFEERAAFVADLVADIHKAIAWCETWNFIPVFRLNGTSDIRWELASHNGRKVIADIFSHIQFYDYTKLSNRKNLPSNYHLTFSLSEDNHDRAAQALESGMNVAMVFRNKATVGRYMALGLVHDGDDSDLRFLDPQGVTALYAKGPAKRDLSGFVHD